MSDRNPITPELFDDVLNRIANGDTLREVARQLNFHEATFRAYARENNERSTRYTRAREDYAFSRHDRLIDLANTPCGDQVQVAQLRVLIDAEKWSIARTHPKAFGERLEVNGTQTHEAGDTLRKFLDGMRSGGEK